VEVANIVEGSGNWLLYVSAKGEKLTLSAFNMCLCG